MAGLLGGGPKMPSAPKPVSIPDPESPEALERRRRRMQERAARGGRQSTILSGEAPMYSNTALGT